MNTLKYIAGQTLPFSTELHGTWIDTVPPVAMHDRLDHFSSRTLGDPRQRLASDTFASYQRIIFKYILSL